MMLLSVLLVSCQSVEITEIEKLPLPKTYIAPFINEPIQIDGAHETAWQRAPWSEAFIDIEGHKKPRFNTQVKMLWDNESLYLLAKLEEPHIWGNLKQRDTVIFYNNDFEVFIDPDGDTHDYMELEINALNTAWDLFLNKPYLNKNRVDNQWDIEGMQSAVAYQGTLNDPTDIDQGWQLEIALPWESLVRGNPGNTVPKNQFWRINFSRVNWDFSVTNGAYARKKDASGKFMPEYNWVWSPQGVINMHLPEFWGFVYFSDSASKQTYNPPGDTALILWMYTQFREAAARERKQLPMSKIPRATFYGKPLTFEKKVDNDTLYWTTINPHNQRTYQIRYDGKLRVKKEINRN